jgi:hypothetical protein
MAFKIEIVDPTPTQLAQLLAIMYPGFALASPDFPAPAVLAHADNPETGTPSPGEAFGIVSTVAPEVALAFAPQSVQPGPTPEAAFAGNGTAPIAGAPVGTTPAQPPAPAASAPSGVQVDKRGIPWDIRIHAKAATGGGTLNADGTWRAKRGLNDGALVAQIERELLAVMAAPGPTVSAAPLSPALASQVVGNVPPPPLATAAPGPAVPSAVTGVPVPPAPPAAGGAPVSYPDLVHAVVAGMGAGKITDAEVTAACQAYGVQSLPLLGVRPDLVASVAAVIHGTIAARG